MPSKNHPKVKTKTSRVGELRIKRSPDVEDQEPAMKQTFTWLIDDRKSKAHKKHHFKGGEKSLRSSLTKGGRREECRNESYTYKKKQGGRCRPQQEKKRNTTVNPKPSPSN